MYINCIACSKHVIVCFHSLAFVFTDARVNYQSFAEYVPTLGRMQFRSFDLQNFLDLSDVFNLILVANLCDVQENY